MTTTNTWLRIAGIWCVRSATGRTGEWVTVRSRAGVEKRAILGEEFLPANPQTFRYVATPPAEISGAMVESGVPDGSWPVHLSYFLVDGKKVTHNGCSNGIWEGTTASGMAEIEFTCSVLHDVFYVCLKRNGDYVRHPHYCGVKGFGAAVDAVRIMWAKN